MKWARTTANENGDGEKKSYYVTIDVCEKKKNIFFVALVPIKLMWTKRNRKKFVGNVFVAIVRPTVWL